MAKSKFDVHLVRFLLLSSLILSLLVTFWLLFETIKTYQQINGEVEEYLQKALLLSNATQFSTSDETIEGMLDKRLESLKALLTLLLYVVVILFGLIATLLESSPLMVVFSLVITSALVVNAFVAILEPQLIVVLAIVCLTIGWLFVDLNRNCAQEMVPMRGA